MVDHYGEVVATDDSSVGELLPVDVSLVTLSGTTKTTSVEGIFIFTGFTIHAAPGTDIGVKVSTTAIDDSQSTKAADNATYVPTVVIDVAVRT
jgi:hypothetical protein